MLVQRENKDAKYDGAGYGSNHHVSRFGEQQLQKLDSKLPSIFDKWKQRPNKWICLNGAVICTHSVIHSS